MEEKKKRVLSKIKEDIESILIRDKLSAREILLILRELESDAMIALLYGQIALQQVEQELENGQKITRNHSKKGR